MRTYYRPHNDIEWYYIRYIYEDEQKDKTLHEFWADNSKEFEDKLIYIKRNVRYTLLLAQTPLTG